MFALKRKGICSYYLEVFLGGGRIRGAIFVGMGVSFLAVGFGPLFLGVGTSTTFLATGLFPRRPRLGVSMVSSAFLTVGVFRVSFLQVFLLLV